MRLRWWQYVVGFLVAVLSIAAMMACLVALAFVAQAVSTRWAVWPVMRIFMRVVLFVGFAILVAAGVAALIGMGIDIAESWLWPVPKGTRERP
jgi:hypothetical protein